MEVHLLTAVIPDPQCVQWVTLQSQAPTIIRISFKLIKIQQSLHFLQEAIKAILSVHLGPVGRGCDSLYHIIPYHAILVCIHTLKH